MHTNNSTGQSYHSPASVKVVGYSEQEEGVELEGLWEHPQHLVDTVQELEEDGRSLVGVLWVAQPLLELVAKGKPLFFNQDLCTYIDVSKTYIVLKVVRNVHTYV